MRRRAFVAVASAAALSLSGCGYKGLYSANLPGGADLGNNPFTVTVYFSDVLDLVPQSAVKVNDVAVGKVTAISLGDDKNCQGAQSIVGTGATGSVTPVSNLNGTVAPWCAKVTLSVNRSVKLPANARALVSQTSLLGEKYVALLQPTDAATGELGNNSSISLANTQSAPEAEEVLGALSLLLNNGGLAQIKIIATDLNQALKGNESAVRDLVNQLSTFSQTLGSQVDKITTALENVDRLAITLNNQKRILVQTLDNFPQALQILSQERSKLTQLLVSLSRLGGVASNVINATQANLVSTLKSLHPTLVELTNAGDALPGALRIAGSFPFPLGATRTLVKGDYANLDAVVNLDLTQQLCGALGTYLPASAKAALCTAVAGASNSSTQLNRQSAATYAVPSSSTTASRGVQVGSVGSSIVPSMLIGAGK